MYTKYPDSYTDHPANNQAVIAIKQWPITFNSTVFSIAEAYANCPPTGENHFPQTWAGYIFSNNENITVFLSKLLITKYNTTYMEINRYFIALGM